MRNKVTEIGVSSDAWLGCCRRRLLSCGSFSPASLRNSQFCRESLHTPPLSGAVDAGSFQDIFRAVGYRRITRWPTPPPSGNRQGLCIHNTTRLQESGVAVRLFDCRHAGVFTPRHRESRIINIPMWQVGYSA